MNKVILRAIGRNKWAGVTYYKNCATYLAPYFTRSGSIYTGISPEDDKTKTRLEKALQQDLSPTSNFWQTYFIRVGTKDIYIDPSTPRGELDYLFLRNHKRVAKSLKDIKPSHDFILIDENAEAEVANVYNRSKIGALKEFDKMSMTERRKALRIYGFNPDNLSDEVVENRLIDFIEKDPERFKDIWIDNKHRDTEYLIKQSIANGTMSRNKNVYKYGQETIGHSMDEVIDFLENPIHNDIKIVLLKETQK